MVAPLREVRLKEKADATMFVAAMGAPIDGPGSCHDLSHFAQDAGEMSAASVISRLQGGGVRVDLASGDPDDTDTARRLIDVSLMKLRAQGQSLVRVALWPAGSGAVMWTSSEWLGRLGEIESPRHRVPAPNNARSAQLPAPPAT